MVLFFLLAPVPFFTGLFDTDAHWNARPGGQASAQMPAQLRERLSDPIGGKGAIMGWMSEGGPGRLGLGVWTPRTGLQQAWANVCPALSHGRKQGSLEWSLKFSGTHSTRTERSRDP